MLGGRGVFYVLYVEVFKDFFRGLKYLESESRFVGRLFFVVELVLGVILFLFVLRGR